MKRILLTAVAVAALAAPASARDWWNGSGFSLDHQYHSQFDNMFGRGNSGDQAPPAAVPASSCTAEWSRSHPAPDSDAVRSGRPYVYSLDAPENSDRNSRQWFDKGSGNQPAILGSHDAHGHYLGPVNGRC